LIIKIKCYFPLGTLLLATANLQDSSGNWENKAISISSLSRNIGEDKSYEISGITIEFNDSDRFFRQMMSGDNRYIAGKTVELLDSSDTIIYTGNVEKWEFQEGSFAITINDRLSGLDAVIPETLTRVEYPDMAEEGDGHSFPLIYGYVYGEAGAVKSWKVAANKYLLADHHCLSIEKAYDKDGKDITASCTLSNEGSEMQNNARAFIDYTWSGDPEDPQEPEFINADVKGKNNSGTLIEDPIDVLDEIIRNRTGMTLSSLNLEENRTIMAERNYKMATVINNQKVLKDFLKDFAFSFDCDFYLSKGNEIVITLLDWGSLEAAKSLSENQVTSFKLQELPEEIRNKVKYMYRYNYAEDKYQRTPLYEKQESIANWGEFYNKNEALEFLHVYDDETSFDVVQRFAFQHNNPRRIASVEIPLDEFTGLDISDIIDIRHPGAIDAKSRKYQIRRVNVDFVTDSVQIECLDINSLTGGIFILGDDTIAENWEDADDHDRQYAYLCGSDGFFANGIDEGKILY
jgi:hypothetical protein